MMMLAALLMFIIGASAQTSEEAYTKDLLQPGEAAPAIEMNNMFDKPFKLQDQLDRNYFAIVNFWASWCPDCRKEIPELKRLVKKYYDYGVCPISVSFDTDSAAWKGYIRKEELKWIHVSELKKWKHGTEIDKAYHVNWIPTTYLISPEGKIVKGTIHIEELETTIDSLIAAGKITKTVLPKFPGDLAFFLKKNLRYPKDAWKNGIQAKIKVNFVLEKDGSIDSIKVDQVQLGPITNNKVNHLTISERNAIIQHSVQLLEEEAIRVVKIMPRWAPAIINGKKAGRVWYHMPVVFRL